MEKAMTTKTFELTTAEISLIEYAFVCTLLFKPKDPSRTEIKALRHKLKPKPVKKEGWIVVWSDGGRTCIFDTWEEADARYQNYRETGEIIKVTWEEVE